MPDSERSRELIQKYLEDLASEAEHAELQQLLATDPDVANAFAAAARMHANLQRHFQTQYKLDQVAAFLNAPESPASPERGSLDTGAVGAAEHVAAEVPTPPASTFVRSLPSQSAQTRGRLHSASRRLRSLAAVALLVAIGAALWSFQHAADGQPRLISGRVAVAGHEVSRVSENELIEVVGPDAAVIRLSGGAQIELQRSARAIIRHAANPPVVVLNAGAANFKVSENQSRLRVETAIGAVTTTGGRFSLELLAASPERISATAPLSGPSLTVVVTEGTVNVEHGGVVVSVSAGERRVFVNQI